MDASQGADDVAAQPSAEAMARLETLQEKLRELQQVAQPSDGALAAESDDDDSEVASIDSGAESDSDAVRTRFLWIT